LIPLGEFAGILLVVTPGLVGERDDIPTLPPIAVHLSNLHTLFTANM